MKNTNMFFGIMVLALTIISCKNNKEAEALKSIKTFVVYVDSLDKISHEAIKDNWEQIDSNYQVKFVNAEIALENLKENDKTKEEQKIDDRKTAFYNLKARLETMREASNIIVNSKQKMRNALLNLGEIGKDINFGWVNASNICDVYSYFVTVVENNKVNYSREDWEEIKLIYEALGNRKNAIEEEGLSTYDNRKISDLKFKFASIYHIYKIRAKSEEMDRVEG